MTKAPNEAGETCAQARHNSDTTFENLRIRRSNAPRPRRPGRPLRPLTPEQQELAAQNIGLVGVHLKSRLGARRRIRAGRGEMGELFQAGCLALVQAAGRYKPQRDGEFPAYALPRIRRAVHAAILAGRGLVRVPYGAACAGRRAEGLISARARGTVPTGADLKLLEAIDERVSPDDESIRHALRRRFEQGVREAVKELSQRNWRRPDAAAILARVSAERVLIADSQQRTPVRRLASQLNISTGRIAAWEQRILAAAFEHLRDDALTRLLIQFSQEDPAGFDGPVHAARRQRLLRAEVKQFEARFARLDPAERAAALYRLVERSSPSVREVARNLFLLARRNS